MSPFLVQVVPKKPACESIPPVQGHSRLGPVEENKDRRADEQHTRIQQEELVELGQILGIQRVPEEPLT
jgi:hypothetical protein